MTVQETIHGDCLEVLRGIEDCHFSGIITDPPYGISFMGKKWDSQVPDSSYWKEFLRVCKPGSHLLAMGGTRTYHRLACAIEDAGWELRDCMMWIYGQGFPKSHNIFGLPGYGTCLKPAYEPIIMAMKPCDGTFKQNAEKWGVAGINIDECRITTNESFGGNGRWPANVILDEEVGVMLDEQSGVLKSGGGDKGNKTQDGGYGKKFGYVECIEQPSSGGASRFFYCAKASSSERNEGLADFELKIAFDNNTGAMGANMGSRSKPRQNNHPTVKPLKLMEYLIKLIMPPKNGVLLDPFAGSGTTILAAKRLEFDAIGIEKCEEYCNIAKARVNSVMI